MVPGGWRWLQGVIIAAWGRRAMWEDGTSPACCGFSLLQGCCWSRSRRVQPEVCLETTAARRDIRQLYILSTYTLSFFPFFVFLILYFLFRALKPLFLESLTGITDLLILTNKNRHVRHTQTVTLFYLASVVMVKHAASLLFCSSCFLLLVRCHLGDEMHTV